MIKEFMLGVSHFLKAPLYLSKKGLLHYYLWPLVVAILLYVSLFSSIFYLSDIITEKIFGRYSQENIGELLGTNGVLAIITQWSIKGIMTVIYSIIVLMLSAKFSKYFVLIVLAPLFSFLSERIEEIETGRKYPFSGFQLLKDMLRGTLIALRNLTIELALIALFGLLGLLIGPFTLLTVPFLWLVSAYYFGFSMMDYTCERKKMSIKEGIQFIKSKRSFALGIGVVYALLDMVPIVGLMIAPINGVVGATLGILEMESKE